MKYVSNITTSAISFRQTVTQDPNALVVGGVGLVLATAPITVPAVLGAAGFSAAGPVAASVAAGWQSSMGLVQAGSMFATLQSAAMGGAAGSLAAASNIGLVMTGGAAVKSQWSGIKTRFCKKERVEQAEKAEPNGKFPMSLRL